MAWEGHQTRAPRRVRRVKSEEDELILPFLMDVDTLNEQRGTENVVCNRCGKCCKLPGTDDYCQYLGWIWHGMTPKGYELNISYCKIYNSRNGRYIGTTHLGKIYCYPRMYELNDIPGCAYQDHIDEFKRVIKNE